MGFFDPLSNWLLSKPSTCSHPTTSIISQPHNHAHSTPLPSTLSWNSFPTHSHPMPWGGTHPANKHGDIHLANPRGGTHQTHERYSPQILLFPPHCNLQLPPTTSNTHSMQTRSKSGINKKKTTFTANKHPLPTGLFTLLEQKEPTCYTQPSKQVEWQ